VFKEVSTRSSLPLPWSTPSPGHWKTGRGRCHSVNIVWHIIYLLYIVHNWLENETCARLIECGIDAQLIMMAVLVDCDLSGLSRQPVYLHSLTLLSSHEQVYAHCVIVCLTPNAALEMGILSQHFFCLRRYTTRNQ